MSQLKKIIAYAAERPAFILDWFLAANLLFLGFDIILAHSINSFAEPVEYAPLFVSLIGGALLVINLLRPSILPPYTVAVIAWVSVITGIAGFIYHLESQFFQSLSIRSLVYTAPFVAPLAYSGIGLLLIMRRMVSASEPNFSLWIIFMAAGGFAGNFILSLADHAQNGFYNVFEWVPVISAAFATTFLTVIFFIQPVREYIRLTEKVMWAQVAVGFAGFLFHLYAIITRFQSDVLTRFIYGAPLFAPMLFADIAMLGLLGLWSFKNNSEINSQ